MLSLLLAGCILPQTDDTAGTCDQVLDQLAAEQAAVQACTTWSECGQVMTGTSCGCTRDLVARLDADTTDYYATLARAGELECDLPDSTCDCPDAYGFDCVDHTCAWDYASGPYLPDCQAERGTTYDVAGISLSGEDLTITVGYSGGCSEHTFTLCWPAQAFTATEPPEVTLELFHQTDDHCEAYLNEDVVVSLAPLREAWAAENPGVDGGVIVVNVAGERVRYVF